MIQKAPPDPTDTRAPRAAREPSQKLGVLITAKKRAWCGELYTTLIGAHGLAARGHDVTVAHNVGSAIADRLDRDLVRVEEFDFQRGVRHWPSYFATARRLRKTIQSTGIDIVETHASWDHWLSAVALSRMRERPPLLRFRHNRKEIKKHAPNKWLYSRATDAFAAQTEYVREDILRTGYVPESRVNVLGSAIDLGRFKSDPEARVSTRAQLGIPDEARILGYVGRFSARKRPGHLIEIHRALALTRPDTHLVIVGWGEPEFAKVIKEAAKANALVHFLGPRRHPEAFYPAFDVFALPSHSESFPRAALEAMACGVPTVTGHDSGLRGFVRDGESGRVLADDSPAAFSAAVTKLIENPAAAAEMGERGQALVRAALNPDAYVDRLEQLMLATVAAHGAASART